MIVGSIDDLRVVVAADFSLDTLANARQIFRYPGETDADLRERVLGPVVVRTVEEE